MISPLKLVKEYAQVLFFVAVASLVTCESACSQFPQRHSIRASVRPNDSTKYTPSLPWVGEFTPPLVYEEWYHEILACEHVNEPAGLLESIHWVAVNARTFHMGVTDQGDNVFGYADGPNLTIYLAMPSLVEEAVVKHEIMHIVDFVRGVDEGDDYHPFDTFMVCGLTVHHAALK